MDHHRPARGGVECGRDEEGIAAAIEWLSALSSEFGHIFENRQKHLMSSPSVMAALGAMGHALVEIGDAQDRKLRARELIKSIKDVNWSRDKTWEGIAGKFTPNTFSIGGAKETAYAVFAALTDKNATSYKKVRTPSVEIAA
jgi:DNA sulfur modification protein DndB